MPGCSWGKGLLFSTGSARGGNGPGWGGGFGGWGSCSDDADEACDYDGNGAADDQVYFVTLPAGLPSYRVTLVYDDLAGAGGLLARGAAALVNDLDLYLIEPSGRVVRPLILKQNAARLLGLS